MNNNECTTVVFHERIEPIIDMFGDDPAAFGNIMLALFSYSIDGDVVELDDKYQNAVAKTLRSMIDLGRQGSRSYRVNQTIKSNLKYADSEADMRKRLEKNDFTEDEIQIGIDRYRQKQNKDAGLNEDGQYPKGTSWDLIEKQRGF